MVGISDSSRWQRPRVLLPALLRPSSFPKLSLFQDLAAIAFPFQSGEGGNGRRRSLEGPFPETSAAFTYPIGEEFYTTTPCYKAALEI